MAKRQTGRNVRTARIIRNTKETQIQIKLNVDGSGKYKISTGLSFLDHMLELFAKHGLFDLEIRAKGDLHIDAHHTVEDIGISLGKAFGEALGDRSGIERYSSVLLPMDETLCEVAVDISGRPHLTLLGKLPKSVVGKQLNATLIRHFFEAFVVNASLTLHADIRRGEDPHHISEGLFKAFAVAMLRACAINPRKKGVPSTKGIL